MTKTVTWVLGIVLLAIGILGFFQNPVLGQFEVNLNHNLVHLVSGIIAIVAAAMGESMSRLFLLVFGVVYGLVAIAGFVTGGVFGFIVVNAADNYLHAAIAVVCLAVGFSGSGKRTMTGMSA